jgi:hypothetical protein
MAKHHSNNPGAYDDAVQTAALLKPKVEDSVRRLSPAQRDEMKLSLLSAEKLLADAKVAPAERLRKVQAEFQTHVALGSTWLLIAGKISDYRAGAAAGKHELSSVSLMLGMILDAIHQAQQDQKTRAA